MCGIAGIIGNRSEERETLRERCSAMTESIHHRGPDDAGIWVAEGQSVVFGHRRLSIVDLSAAGHQPMLSHDRSGAIVFNGEIYNFEELRSELDGSQATTWRGHSDTEVMLEAAVRWGTEKMTRRLNGMFVFAVYDSRLNSVVLARDRFGVKPLYVGRARDNSVLFGSEVRTLASDPNFSANLNASALSAYFTLGYVPRTDCIYGDAVSLAPGSMVTFSDDAQTIDWDSFLAVARSASDGPFDFRGRGWHYRTFWTASESVGIGRTHPFAGSLTDAVTELESLLTDAVKIRLVADVPLGALLSGGIDSSLVVALMQRLVSQPVRTFSIGFSGTEFDESRHAEAVARHLGTNHTTLDVGRDDALKVAARVGALLDEPLADESFVPTYLVSKLTRQHVTVAMTGDGGDELFGGYWRYRKFRGLRSAYSAPAGVRKVIDSLAKTMETPLPWGRGPRWAWYRAVRLMRLAAQRDFESAYRYATSSTTPLQRILAGGAASQLAPLKLPGVPLDYAERMMHFDVQSYLPDDLLVKMDRASMAVGLECREPLLDYRLHEFSARLPVSFKLHGCSGKRILRELLFRHVPREIVDRPKRGFTPPLAQWLRNELRDCVEETLMAKDRSSFLFAEDGITRLWREHQEQKWNHAGAIWQVFVLKQWLAAHRWS